MKFSLVFPTRSRVQLLDNLLRSLDEMTADCDSVEVMPIYDDDDQDMVQEVESLAAKYPRLRLNFVCRTRSAGLNRDYINYGSQLSMGKYLFILNDDTEFMTRDWDVIAWRKLEDFLADKPDGIVYGNIDDSMGSLKKKQRLSYCGFPIISRAAFLALGYAMHPAFQSWGADIHLFRVYNRINRVVDLSEIRVFHHGPHTNSREKDDIHNHVAFLSSTSTEKHVPDQTLEEDIRKLCSIIGMAVPRKPIHGKVTPALDQKMETYRRRMQALQRFQAGKRLNRPS